MKSILDSKFVFYSFSLLICFLLYYPTLTGGPMWDDIYFHFNSEVITSPDFSLFVILKDFNWALTTLIQRFTYFLFQENYIYYHFLNLTLHFLNSLLFLNFLKFKKIKYPQWGFLVFLLHPSMIMTVSWMIQIKTLVCGLLVLLSLNALELSKGSDKNKIFFFTSFLFYILSLSAKISSVPLIIVMLIEKWKTKYFKLLFIPVIIACLFTLKFLNSPVITDSEYQSLPSSLTITFFQTFNWYFWQAAIPLESIPIRGPFTVDFPQTIVGLFTIITFFFLIRRNKMALSYFIMSFIMMLPFLGIIPAPFMSSAWVSDQHLYLVLIFSIPAMSLLIEKIPSIKVSYLVRGLVLSFIGIISLLSINNYKDELHFFKSSFDYNHNIAAGAHLLSHYVAHNLLEEANDHYYFMVTTFSSDERTYSNNFWAQIEDLGQLLMQIDSN